MCHVTRRCHDDDAELTYVQLTEPGQPDLKLLSVAQPQLKSWATKGPRIWDGYLI